MDELGPCPFCRQDFAAPGQEGTGHFVICGACGARGPRKPTPEEAVEAWHWWRVSTHGKAEPREPFEPERIVETDPVPLVGGNSDNS